MDKDWEIFNDCQRALAERRPGDALAMLRARRPPDSPIWGTLASLEAECLSQLGRHAEATTLLEDAAARDPRNYWVFYNLSIQYRQLGRFDAAMAAARRVHACLGWEESLRHGYEFTHDFFSANIADWTDWFATLITAAPIRCLEIGSWQGGSATWLLDKVVGPRGGSLTCIDTFEGSSEHAGMLPGLGRTLEQIFDANIARTGRAALCQKLVGASQDVLPWLRDERFDFIYVDGAHEAKYVIQDAVLCWPLVRPGGFLLFDDTHYLFADKPEQNTETAIVAFLRWFAAELEVLTPLDRRQLLVRKRAT